jgi:thiol-disulfide isomerase/thioredoxin
MRVMSGIVRQRALRRGGLLAVVVALVLALGVFVWRAQAPASAPVVAFNLVDGQVLPSERLHGRVTLVHFWATTCGICMVEMPQLVQTYRDLHERGFDVVAVAMPYDRPDLVLDYRKRTQLPFSVAIDYTGEVNRAYGGIEGTPTSFLIDAQGHIVQRIVGAPDFTRLRADIESRLPAAKS